MSDWSMLMDVECVECPRCGFTFAAEHTATDGSGYSCPVCAEAALTARVAQLEACLTGHLATTRTRRPEVMAHLRSTVRTCDTPGCSTRESEALYSFRNDLHGYYCKRHAPAALRARTAAEEQFFADQRNGAA